MSRRQPFAPLSPPLLFAHRGGAGLWPENTLVAFENCQKLGRLILETDVRVSGDERLIVFHDAHLERVTERRGRVRERELDELKRLDAGYWFTPDGEHYPWRSRGQRILTVDELFTAFPQAYYNIELKAGSLAPRLMWQALERHRMLDRVLIAAADHALICAFRKLARDRVATSASRREVLWYLATRALRTGGPRRLPFVALQLPWKLRGRRWLRRSLIDAAHRDGLQLHVWTINEPSEIRQALKLGVDGVMSDFPDRLVQALAPPAAQREPLT